MNSKINDTLDWYQTRIGSYDKQLWEQSLEKKLFKNNFYCITKNSSKVQDFIDIDLIKGSTFSKAKSNFSLTHVMLYGILRLLFYPFHVKWWRYQVGSSLAVCLFVLYIVQITNLITYYMYPHLMQFKQKQVITLVEILTPALIMLILGVMYTYITSTLPTSTSDYDRELAKYFGTSLIPSSSSSSSSPTRPHKYNNKTSDSDHQQQLTKQLQALNILSSSCTSDEDEDDDVDLNDKVDDDDDDISVLHNNNKATSLNSSGILSSSIESTPRKKNNKVTIETPKSNGSSSNTKKNNFVRMQSLNLSAVREKISCIIWDVSEWKGADLSMLEISNSIISNAKNEYLGLGYFYIGMIFSFIIAVTPFYFYNSKALIFDETATTCKYMTSLTNDKTAAALNCTLAGGGEWYNEIVLVKLLLDFLHDTIKERTSTIAFEFWLNVDFKVCLILLSTLSSTIILCMLFFSLLAIAERTLKQRLLYAKYFCYLTSNRKARKHNLPHFRLSRVENVKTWLSIRSYMKKRGPQRSINAIISATFLIGVVLCSIVCIQFLRDSDFLLNNLFNWQLVIWCLCIWTFMSRFMTVGFKINKKYRNCMSIVIMEQINLYLQIEKLSEKKDELTIVNNVLKLAADLLKEIEKPFRISGLSVNPWLYNVTKVVILSAFSAVLSELFGFKLKLHKIKIN